MQQAPRRAPPVPDPFRGHPHARSPTLYLRRRRRHRHGRCLPAFQREPWRSVACAHGAPGCAPPHVGARCVWRGRQPRVA